MIAGTLGLLGGVPAARGAPDTLVYGLYDEPESLDSAKADKVASTYPIWLMCDALIDVSKDGQTIVPALAQSWTSSADGRHVVVRLRPNVTLHDGTPLTGDVVRQSLERQFRPRHELYTAEPRNTKEQLLRDLIDSVEADGLQVTLRLKYPGFHHLTQIDIVSPAALHKLGREFARRPVCSGPFKIEKWVPGEEITVVANPGHWRYGGRAPRVRRVEFRFFTEPITLVEAFEDGKIDFAPILSDPVYLERVRKKMGERSIVPVPPLNVYFLGFYTERSPFNVQAVRRAIGQAIDVPRIVQVLVWGAAMAARGPLGPEMQSYDRSIGQPPFDPEAARTALARAGYGAGLKVTLVHHEMKGRDTEVAEAIKDSLRHAGVTVSLVGKPGYPQLNAAIKEREGDMFLQGWHVRAPYPERILTPLFHSSQIGGSNRAAYSNATVDKLLDEAVVIPPGPDRDRAFARAQQAIIADAPMIFLYHLTRTALVGPRLGRIELGVGAHPVDKLVNVGVGP